MATYALFSSGLGRSAAPLTRPARTSSGRGRGRGRMSASSSPPPVSTPHACVCSTKDSTVSPGYHSSSSIGLSCPAAQGPRDIRPPTGWRAPVCPSSPQANNLTDQVIAPLSVSTTVPSVTCRLPPTPHFLSTSFDPRSNGRRLAQIGPTSPPGPWLDEAVVVPGQGPAHPGDGPKATVGCVASPSNTAAAG